MVIMEHPSGCVHNVRETDIEKFRNAGWTVKAAPSEPPKVPAEQKKTKRKK